MDVWIWAVLVVMLVTGTQADTPANCTFDDIRGDWTIYETERTGDDNIVCDEMGPIVHKKTISLMYPNVAVDEFGNEGTWTMVYNQGFEIKVSGRSYYAFSLYEKSGKTVISLCDKTMVGWSRDITVRNWACYRAQKKTLVTPKNHTSHVHAHKAARCTHLPSLHSCEVYTEMENTTEHEAAFKMNSIFFQEKRTPGEVKELYSQFSQTYEQLMNSRTYAGPRVAAEEIARLVPQECRKDARVLDVAAGTGKVGQELYKRGFTWLDAVEPSTGMLEILYKTEVYSQAFKEFLGHGNSTIPTETYDVVVNVGGMGEGHIPVRGVDDMINLTKPGGVVVVVMRLEYLEIVKEYRDRLETRMNLLEKSGRWSMVLKKTIPRYFCDKEGIIFIYRVI